MPAGVGPELMAVLEGESLFNDASSITLFEVQQVKAV
jgi:NhaP-type Na+/H+ or K+/H+ antiporter